MLAVKEIDENKVLNYWCLRHTVTILKNRKHLLAHFSSLYPDAHFGDNTALSDRIWHRPNMAHVWHIRSNMAHSSAEYGTYNVPYLVGFRFLMLTKTYLSLTKNAHKIILLTNMLHVLFISSFIITIIIIIISSSSSSNIIITNRSSIYS
jgi:hypothetical protein